MLTPSSEIDAVITWVNGSDPAHKAKREARQNSLSTPGEIPIIAGRDNTRFQDNGELKYCLASIRKFAPWIRNIYLITDKQTPNFLTKEILKKQKIFIIDHEEIFESYEWALPTFNSISIETAIWRIKELSSNFIYFNDDFILTAPVKPTDFFQDGKVVLYGAWHRTPNFGPWRIRLSILLNLAAKKLFGINRALSLLQQIKAAQIAGYNRHYFRTPHIPHPLRKETMKVFYESNTDIFQKNISFPFRDTSQHFSIALANHLEIKYGNAILKECNDDLMICFNRDTPRKIKQKIRILEKNSIKFLCIQSFEESTPRQRETIKHILDENYAQRRPSNQKQRNL
ncbi:Stealth CR1 domain-containing protein [Spongiibacter nanhainus]|uniref:Stealth CR1 domain-containing protein n=1 Tax=Spongiibacter nanhainus TaxID=2794344 RepID=A0A7T4R436_9GAMM|nr:stealth family protein [Spongiibacter nanhainus]QQD20068.1 Stealth CR1 domain-containing protein [Spongiibacter nanhainus]